MVVRFSLLLVWELTDAHPIADLEMFAVAADADGLGVALAPIGIFAVLLASLIGRSNASAEGPECGFRAQRARGADFSMVYLECFVEAAA